MKSKPALYGYRMQLSVFCMMMTITAGVSAQTGERYSFEFHDAPLDNALFQISRASGTDIIYESRFTSGIRVTGEFRNELLAPLLTRLLRPSGLEARRIRTGMYVLQYALRSEMDPITQVPVTGRYIKPAIRSEVMGSSGPPGPLRDRPWFWQ